MNKLENIDHIAIQVKNIKKSVKWYTDNYNCKVIFSDDTWGFLQFENIKLAFCLLYTSPSPRDRG